MAIQGPWVGLQYPMARTPAYPAALNGQGTLNSPHLSLSWPRTIRFRHKHKLGTNPLPLNAA